MHGKDYLLEQRLAKLGEIKRRGDEPFKYRFERTHLISQLRDEASQHPQEKDEGTVIAGRLISLRVHGKSAFAHLRDGSGQIQLYFRLQEIGEEVYRYFLKLIDIGDFLGVKGNLFTTERGELTLLVTELSLLSKSLRCLPEKWHGLKDKETRYRQRYLDLIANQKVKEDFLKRSEIIKALRTFLDEHDFVEVETPMIQAMAGGALARPFITYHNALGTEFFLRIAPELYLKRLMVGGFEKIYELNRNFRNEGISPMHNPEFTMLELYQAYADYYDLMTLTEEMICSVATAVLGTSKVQYQGVEVDLKPPWQRIPFLAAMEEFAGLKDFEDEEAIKSLAHEKGISLSPGAGKGKYLDQLLKECVVPHLKGPAFLIDYPLELSPLAKKKRDDEKLTERFQPFICGLEIGNAFSELNDPIEQRERFLEQLRQREKGDEEAHLLDEDFIRALEYGMPPTAGLGVGIDRLVMLLTDRNSIREVVLFPLLRPLSLEKEKEEQE